MHRRHSVRRWGALVAITGLVFAGCSSSGGDKTDDTPAGDTTVTTVEAESDDGPLMVLITNDDGIDAPGIDTLATAISGMDDVEIHVVAPAGNQSATGDRTTDGEVAHTDAETASGIEGIAVDGYPADTVELALDQLGLEPDLVASGINQGQNVGPVTAASGTVGAAMTAARRGIPAVAASAGFGDGADYDAAADLVVDWIDENRDAIEKGDHEVDGVVNINVPDCTAGESRGPAHVELAAEIPDGVSPFTADCSVEVDFDEPDDDVQAIANGWAAITEIPISEPGIYDDDDAAAGDTTAGDDDSGDDDSGDDDTDTGSDAGDGQ